MLIRNIDFVMGIIGIAVGLFMIATGGWVAIKNKRLY
jgi:hypothetical protein